MTVRFGVHVEEPKQHPVAAFIQMNGDLIAPIALSYAKIDPLLLITYLLILSQTNVMSTMSFEELQIKQDFCEKDYFPWLIPTQTRQLPINTQLNWAGVCLADLITDTKTPPTKIKKYLTTPFESHKFLRIKKNANLIAVINALDKPLEHFWALNRRELYNALKINGFSIATGPTFSVYSQLSPKKYIPDSHSVLMLRRQNKVLQELYDYGITPVPNIYWRNNRDQNAWVNWLSQNNSIYLISRDFSSTKKGFEYENGINH